MEFFAAKWRVRKPKERWVAPGTLGLMVATSKAGSAVSDIHATGVTGESCFQTFSGGVSCRVSG